MMVIETMLHLPYSNVFMLATPQICNSRSFIAITPSINLQMLLLSFSVAFTSKTIATLDIVKEVIQLEQGTSSLSTSVS